MGAPVAPFGNTRGQPARAEREAPAAPALSVVLPVLNESRDLPVLLDRLRRQQPVAGGVEVIVADGGSTDGTVALVERLEPEWPALRLVHNPRRRSGPGRNAGAAVSRGGYVLFLDGHCVITRDDFLRRHVEIFVETKADCLCRPQSLMGLAADAWSRAIALARHSPLGHNPGSDIYGGEPTFTDPRSAGAAYRREVLLSLGGYDERFDACEDVEFNHRVADAGFTSYRHPDLAVEYRPRSTVGGLFRQMIRYGRGRAHLMGRHPRTAPLPLLALTATTLGGLALPLLLGPARGVPALAGAAALYVGLLLAEGVRSAGMGVAALRVATALAATHGGLLAGFWRGLLEIPRFVRPRERASYALTGENSIHVA